MVKRRSVRAPIALLPVMLLAVLLLTPKDDAKATVSTGVGWHVVCALSHTGKIDPIVSPGVPSMHTHNFYGNTGTDVSSTTESLLAGTTTCSDSLDETAYWVPQLIYKGVPKPASQIVVYYRAVTKPYAAIRSFPAGLRIIAGKAEAKGPQPTAVVSWSCQFDKPRSMPVRCGTKAVTAKIRFPSCWDGVNLDSADHQSHMAYTLTSGACPADHPVAVPKVFIDLRFEGVHNGLRVSLSSGPAYTLHADLFSAWQSQELARLVETCMHAAKNCGKAMV